MKKLLLFSMVAVLGLAFSSCKSCTRKGEAPVLGAQVNVTIKNIFGSPQDGMKVYMFNDVKPTNSTSPSTAQRSAVTDMDGQTTFNVNFTEMNINERTSLYFAVFYSNKDGDTMVAGKEGITLRGGEVQNIEITIPI